ncbi:MAG: hypothetical protein M1274_10490, partial [Actinobacteria bacterium]|nr:hypothetical protein [Actinomycetota bacterium]
EAVVFTRAEKGLRATLRHLDGLREVYRDVLAERPPDSEVDFIHWVIESANRKSPAEANVCEPENDIRPDIRKAARATATHFVVMARAETLRMLGDQDGACAVVEEWMRSVESVG